MTKQIVREVLKSDRLVVRGTSRELDLIRRAARETGKSLSVFIRDAATAEAERALAGANS